MLNQDLSSDIACYSRYFTIFFQSPCILEPPERGIQPVEMVKTKLTIILCDWNGESISIKMFLLSFFILLNASLFKINVRCTVHKNVSLSFVTENRTLKLIWINDIGLDIIASDSLSSPNGFVSSVSSTWREEPSVNGGGWTDISMKIPVPSEGTRWSNVHTATHYRPPPKRQSWAPEQQGYHLDYLCRISFTPRL